MWSLVDIAKVGRAFVLTTHSMEEADALCGRISIMAYGRMRCIGSSLHLKDKFGEGYKVVITHKDDAGPAAAAFVASALPEAKLLSDFQGTATYVLPSGADARPLSAVFVAMQERPESAGIVDWALRQTSMEEVFLRIAHAAEVQNAKELDDAAANEGTAKLSSKKISTTSASIEA